MMIALISIGVFLVVAGIGLWLAVDQLSEEEQRERQYQESQAARAARWHEPTE